MRQEPEGREFDRASSAGETAHRERRERLFPYNSVVGVIDDPEQVDAAVKGLVDNGFAESEVSVLSGKRGVEQIDAKGKRKGLLARVFRLIDGMGEEREHTAHHVRDLEAGHFIVAVEVADQAAKERARDAMQANGGHFINYYSRWSTEEMAP